MISWGKMVNGTESGEVVDYRFIERPGMRSVF